MDIKDFDIDLARWNWWCWQRVFEHQGEPADNPLLCEPVIFHEFLKEYRVVRTIARGRSGPLRAHLRSPCFPLDEVLADPTGRRLDTLARDLAGEFGARKRKCISALSKIAAFLQPDTFSAWDQFARAGLRAERNRGPDYQDYAEYLADKNQLMADNAQRIQSACHNKYPTPFSAVGNRFRRRVVDIYLMRRGGRWNVQLGPRPER